MAEITPHESQMLIEEIMSYIPHRYPMLLVDRILEVDDRIVRAVKNVTMNEPFFQGHYPGRPIMPGVLILEAMAQAGAVMLLSKPAYKGKVPLIGAIDDVKFRRPVVPGDQLVSFAELLGVKGSVGKLRGECTVDGQMVATMTMTFKLLEKES